MFLDPRDMGLYRGVETDPLGSQDQFMQVLAMLCVDIDSGTDILGNKCVIEDSQMRQIGRPGSVPKNKRRAPVDLQGNMGRMRRGKAVAFGNRSGFAAAK